MAEITASRADIRVEPVTPEQWADLEALFGAKGACDGCWCMFWRLRNSVYSKQSSEMHHDELKSIVDGGHVPGLLAYVDGQPAGWCAVGPREDFDAIVHSTVMKRVNDLPVWSIPCFFIGKSFRGKGVMRKLLESAVEYAASQGATLVEGYPAPSDKKISSADAFRGVQSAFSKVGFTEIKRISTGRVLMRMSLDGSGNGINPQV
jgi:GNAT superfamily N-acetyltransferase